MSHNRYIPRIIFKQKYIYFSRQFQRNTYKTKQKLVKLLTNTFTQTHQMQILTLFFFQTRNPII